MSSINIKGSIVQDAKTINKALVNNSWLVESDVATLDAAKDWSFNKGWNIYGIKTFKSISDTNLRAEVNRWVEDILAVIYARVGHDESEYIRINVIFNDADVHKTAEPFRLSQYMDETYVSGLFARFFEKYSNHEISPALQVIVIGKANEGYSQVTKEARILYKHNKKFWTAVGAWSKYAHLTCTLKLAESNNVVYAKYPNNLIIEVICEAKDKFNVKMYALKNAEYTVSLSMWYSEPQILEEFIFTEKYAPISEFTQSVDLHGIVRLVDSVRYYYIEENGRLKYVRSTEHIGMPNINATVVKEDTIDTIFATIDLETYPKKMDNDIIMEPYAIGVYINDDLKKEFYIDDFVTGDNQTSDMMLACLDYMHEQKVKTLYAHNASNFDNLLLADMCLKLSMRNISVDFMGEREGNKIPILNITYKGVKYVIKDSYKLLPHSLKALCKSYNIEDKGIFPHEFITADTVCYNGPKPDIKYYKGMTQEQYNQIPNNINIKEESLKYLQWDCKSLHIILTKFRTEINIGYKIDPLKRQTISGVAYKIWHNLTQKTPEICRIGNNTRMASMIRQAYYGGLSEVYIPTVGIDHTGSITNNKTSAKYYDVNSLYPAIMMNNMMPLGSVFYEHKPKLEKTFGFCYAEIEAPDLPVLLLPVRIKNKTFVTSGSWKGWYFSEELKKAVVLGYKVNVIYSYTFKRTGFIFETYIKPLYETKSTSKDPVKRAISKLLLNSLYGMMGYRGGEDKLELQLKNSELITQRIEKGKGHDQDFSINVAIAAAITSYARMYMYDYRKDSIYHDTDSVVVYKALPDDVVDSQKLGKFKHEFDIKAAAFATSKTYGIVTSDDSIKIATAGIQNGLVSLQDIIDVVKGDQKARNRLYRNHIIRPLIAEGRLVVRPEIVDKRLAGVTESRIKVYWLHLEHGTMTQRWVGTFAWKVKDLELIDPKSYFDIKKCTLAHETLTESAPALTYDGGETKDTMSSYNKKPSNTADITKNIEDEVSPHSEYKGVLVLNNAVNEGTKLPEPVKTKTSEPKQADPVNKHLQEASYDKGEAYDNQDPFISKDDIDIEES